MKTINELHERYIWANRMKVLMIKVLKKESELHKVEKLYQIETTMYMNLWYALLYTVIDGWRKLKLKDASIVNLLRSKNVDLLRKYRNYVFHFGDEKIEELDLLKSKESALWIQNLNSELGKWFLENNK